MRSISEEEAKNLRANNLTERVIYSFFPCDKWECDCQGLIENLKVKFGSMTTNQIQTYKDRLGSVLRCTRNKNGMKLYKIHCNKCNALLAECFATDDTISDWCDLHYICKSVLGKRKEDFGRMVAKKDKSGKVIGSEYKPHLKEVEFGYWEGALAINISPIDGKLGIECACGQDTRDFRANATLPDEERAKLVKRSMQGRELGKQDSKFRASPIS